VAEPPEIERPPSPSSSRLEKLGPRLAASACLAETALIVSFPVVANMTGDGTPYLYAMIGILLVAPLLGGVALFLGLTALRREVVDRAQAARSARLGALALAGPWVLMLVVSAMVASGWD